MKAPSLRLHFVVAVLSASCLAAVFVPPASPAEETPKIRLNTIGYLPAKEKKATIATTCTQFTVVRVKDGAKVLEGATTGPLLNSDTNEQLYTADFSALRETGEFQLEVPGAGKSAPFRVSAGVFNQPFQTVMTGMYLWRCGTAVSATHNGQTFVHGPCHLNDAYLDYVGRAEQKKDGTKGWHDAGDYNKYVVNAGITVGCMFRAWEDFESRLRGIRLGIP